MSEQILTEIPLNNLYFYKVYISQSSEENQNDEITPTFKCEEINCKKLKILGYQITEAPASNIKAAREDELPKQESEPVKFKPGYSSYLDNANFNIKDHKELFQTEIIAFSCDKGEKGYMCALKIQFIISDKKDEEVELCEETRLFCANDDMNAYLDIIKQKYWQCFDRQNQDEDQTANHFDQLKAIGNLFSKQKCCYFVVERKQKMKLSVTVDGDRTYIIQDETCEQFELFIIGSNDLEFKKNLHRMHTHVILSDYHVMKTIESRMDTIIYRSFKDILRLCSKTGKGQENRKDYDQLSKLIFERDSGKCSFTMKNKEGTNISDIIEDKEQEQEIPFENYQSHDSKRDQRINQESQPLSLKEIESIVYKNTCLEGLFPFNIFLNTHQDNPLFNWAKKFASKILSNQSYKMTHHLSTQVGNVFYSFNDSGLFMILEIKEKERSSSRYNEFTKVRVFDFFPLNEQIQKISQYIYERLDTFDAQISFFFSPIERNEKVDNDLNSLLIGLSQFLFPKEDNKVENKLIEDCQKSIKIMQSEPMNRFWKEVIPSIIDQIKEVILALDQSKTNKINDKKLKDLFSLEDFQESFKGGLPKLFKFFMKIILRNDKVPQHKQNFQQNPSSFSDRSVKRGDGSQYKILLRELSYSFLNHYYNEFKYFYSWPLILTETELTNYKYFDNNCQTPGILFSYQIKELLKQYIEPLFICDREEFYKHFKNHFNQNKTKISLKFQFSLPPLHEIPQIDDKNGKSKIVQNVNRNLSSQQNKSIRSSSKAFNQQHDTYKVYYYQQLITQFMVFGSKVNEVLNQSLFPLTLKDPMPYHQFFGETMGCKYMNSLIKGDDLILQVYKVMVEGFAENDLLINKIKEVTGGILGPDFLTQNSQFQYILREAYGHMYQCYSTPKSISKPQGEPLPLNFLSTLFAIYDSIYFMRNKYYSTSKSVSYSGAVSSNQQYDMNQHAQKYNSSFKKSMKQPLLPNDPTTNNSQLKISNSRMSFIKNQLNKANRGGGTASSEQMQLHTESIYEEEQNSNIDIEKQNSSSRSNSMYLSELRKSLYQDQNIIDEEKKKYFKSNIRHQLKDISKELAFYYYNSIRMKQSTFTRKDKLSYIGFLLIKDPSKKYLKQK